MSIAPHVRSRDNLSRVNGEPGLLLAVRIPIVCHCPGFIDWTVYELPEPLSVNRTWSPVFTFDRSTEGATENSIFIAGQLMSGIGP